MAKSYVGALALAIGIATVAGLAPVAPARGDTVERSVCVVVPHFKDEYWLSVGYGLRQAASEVGAELMVYEAGGYHALARQVELLATCRKNRVGAVLIGAVSADDPRLLDAVADTAVELPVLALVNALNAPALSGWIGVDWHGMGLAVGAFLAEQHPVGSPSVTAALITGPDESGWAPILDTGLAEGLSGTTVEIVATYRADTGLREQLLMVEQALAEHPKVDYVIGSAPAVEGAMALLRRMPDGNHRPKLVATYVSHSVLRGLKSGQVEMVPFDDPIAQGRIGLELALGAMRGEHFPGLSGPEIRTITRHNDTIQEIRLSPSGFFPELQ